MAQQDMYPELKEDRETLVGRVSALRQINAILLRHIRDQGSGEPALHQAITDISERCDQIEAGLDSLFRAWPVPGGHGNRTLRAYQAELGAFVQRASS